MQVKSMPKSNNYQKIEKQKQNQILKLVTNSFYRELVNYGVDASDIVTVSVNLLDHITDHPDSSPEGNGYYNNDFSLITVQNLWADQQILSLPPVDLRPLSEHHIAQIIEWLKQSDINQEFINGFPKERSTLQSCLLNKDNCQYFAIYYSGDAFVGIIGADNIDPAIRKMEMKKFIGTKDFRGKGIGKTATFLFLYIAFEIMDFKKVYIHSIDTNIKNINLNSKFGFELEGILYSEAYVNKIYRDVLRMGLLKEKWYSIFHS
jgi:RimJ/RimL family protein N-acetyltransferase